MYVARAARKRAWHDNCWQLRNFWSAEHNCKGLAPWAARLTPLFSFQPMLPPLGTTILSGSKWKGHVLRIQPAKESFVSRYGYCERTPLEMRRQELSRMRTT